jgi:hypothetical protein
MNVEPRSIAAGAPASDLVRVTVLAEGGAQGVARAVGRVAACAAVCVVLSGCAVAMLGGAARSSGSASPSTSSSSPTASKPAAPAPRAASQAPADAAVSTAVRSRFAANSSLKPLKISVDTHDGVVTLRGQVNTVEQRTAAQLEARATRGVKAVKNELTVR